MRSDSQRSVSKRSDSKAKLRLAGKGLHCSAVVMCSFSRKGIVSAAAAAADGHAGGDTNGWEHDNLDCPFTGCLFTRCLFTGCLRTACLFTDCLFTDCLSAGCLFPRCLFTGCLFPGCLFIDCRIACSPVLWVHNGFARRCSHRWRSSPTVPAPW